MNKTEFKSFFLEIIDLLSVVAQMPILLLDEKANPVFRSKYCFQADLNSEGAGRLRQRLGEYMTEARGEPFFCEVAPGMEALIAAPLFFGREKKYIIAGFFVDISEEDRLCELFGEELVSEVIKQNLSPHWDGKRGTLLNLMESVICLVGQYQCQQEVLYYFEQCLETLHGENDNSGPDFWDRILRSLFNMSSAFWSAIVISPKEGARYAYICHKERQIERLNNPTDLLTRWIMETGQVVCIRDLAKDLRGKELAALAPDTRQLTSFPLLSGRVARGVLHVGFRNLVSPNEVQALRLTSLALAFLLRSENIPKKLLDENPFDHTEDLIIGLLDQEEADRVYPLALEALSRVLHRPIGLYSLRDGQFFAVAAFDIDDAQKKRDAELLRHFYIEKRPDAFHTLNGDLYGTGFWDVPVYERDCLIGVLVMRGTRAISCDEAAFVQRASRIFGVALKLKRYKEKMENQQNDILEGMMAMLEAHLHGLRQHAEVTAAYAVQLGRAAGITGPDLVALRVAALLHNIGKARISPALLTKTGKLTLAEKRELENHGKYGSAILSAVPSLAKYAAVLAQLEENVDGSDYPQGFTEGEIHPHARIIRIASTYAALTADRSYHNSLHIHEALEKLDKEAGSKFSRIYLKIFKKVISHEFEGANQRKSVFPGILTPREIEVLQMIAGGRTNAEIAGELYISAKTVKIHVSNILRKLGLKDRTQAAIFYLTDEAFAAKE